MVAFLFIAVNDGHDDIVGCACIKGGVWVRVRARWSGAG